MSINFNNEFKGFLSKSSTYLYLLTKLESENPFQKDGQQKENIKNTLAFILEKQIVFLDVLPKLRNTLMMENILEVIPNNSQGVRDFINNNKNDITEQVKSVIKTTNRAIGNFTFEQSLRKEISAWKEYVKIEKLLVYKKDKENFIEKKKI